MAVKATFTETNQNWQNESTTYWFELSGHDYGTDLEFDGEVFGIAESGGKTTILDSESCPLEEDDAMAALVRRAAIITDDIRKEASGL